MNKHWRILLIMTGLALVTLVACALNALAETPYIEWDNNFGGAAMDSGRSIQQTADGGYIAAGWTEVGGKGDQVYLVKVDAMGHKEWENNYGTALDEYGYSVQQLKDGGYIIAGQQTGIDVGVSGAYLVKTDASGKMLWAKKYPGVCANSIRQTSDGGYIVVGNLISPTKGNQMFLLKTDSGGVKQWQKDYGGKGDEYGNAVAIVNGGYVAVGTSSLSDNGQVYLVRTDKSGNPLSGWPKTYGGNGYEEGEYVQPVSDGSFIVCGMTTSFGNGSQAYMLKIEANGKKVWERNFGGTGNETALYVQATSGGYLLSGWTTSFGNDQQAYVVKTDAGGNKIWEANYGGTGIDCANFGAVTTDGGIVLVGDTGSFSNGWQMYLAKVGVLQWQMNYGGSGYEEGMSALQTADGGCVAVGTMQISGDYQVYLVKTDASGKKQRERSFGGAGEDRGRYISATSDSGYIITGFTNSFGNDYQVYVVKLDASFNKIWEKNYGGAGKDFGSCVMQSGNKYVIACTESIPGKGYQACLLLTDLKGNLLKENNFGGSGTEYGFGVAPAGSGFLLAGYTTSYGNGQQVYVVKTDGNLKKLAEKNYGGAGDDWAASVQQTSDGGYVIAGGSRSFGNGQQAYLIKLNPDLSMKWQKVYGGTDDDYASYVRQTSDKGYILAGLATCAHTGSQAYMVKTDASGNLKWQRMFGGVSKMPPYIADGDAGESVYPVGGSGYLLAGTTSAFGNNGYQVYLVKVA